MNAPTITAPIEHIYPDRAALDAAILKALEANILAAIAARGVACIALCGGSTPIPIYTALSQIELPWSQVQLTLTDERWVDTKDEASNEAMIRKTLLQGPAAKARFTGFKTPAISPKAAETQIDAALATLAQPFDLVLLGMGEDGHIASLFAASEGLEAAMDPLGPLRVRAVYPQDALPRLSLSLPCVMSARRIALLITGANKWDVYQRARQVGPELAGSELDLPVRGVLHQSRAPVEVFWAP